MRIIVNAVAIRLINRSPGEDPIADAIGEVADYLTQSLTNELIARFENEVEIAGEGTDAVVTDIELQQDDPITYTVNTTVQVTTYRFQPKEPGSDIGTNVPVGRVVKTYRMQLVQEQSYWIVNQFDER